VEAEEVVCYYVVFVWSGRVRAPRGSMATEL
jgi:hypothetical protein